MTADVTPKMPSAAKQARANEDKTSGHREKILAMRAAVLQMSELNKIDVGFMLGIPYVFASCIGITCAITKNED